MIGKTHQWGLAEWTVTYLHSRIPCNQNKQECSSTEWPPKHGGEFEVQTQQGRQDCKQWMFCPRERGAEGIPMTKEATERSHKQLVHDMITKGSCSGQAGSWGERWGFSHSSDKSLCLCPSLSVHACPVHVWKAEVDVGCLSPSFSTFFTYWKLEPLVEPGASHLATVPSQPSSRGVWSLSP